MGQLSLSLVVTVSVNQQPAGLGEFNVNNVMLFTNDVPVVSPSAGYAAYVNPEDVATDWGSSSQTSKMANVLFAQTPNILAGGGQLIIAPLLANMPAVIAQQHITFSSVPTVGVYKLKYGANSTGDIAFGDNAAAVQVALRLLAGLSSVTVTGDTSVGFTVVFTGVSGPATLLVAPAGSDTLQDTGGFDVFLTIVTTVVGVAASSTETMINAIQRLQPLVSFCGVMKTNAWIADEINDAAVYVQTQNLIMFVQSNNTTDWAVTTGVLWQIAQEGLNQTRGLGYIVDDYNAASLMMAAYVGRAFSTDFSGSLTTQNMNLKSLNGILADTDITTTLYNLAQAAGVDIYPSVQGVPKVLSSGINKFFDQVYNLMWLKTTVQIDVFNVLATTPTKIPQTEQGMSALKGAVQAVYEQGVVNGYLAPGSWSGGTFGNQGDFLRNIAALGFYIYSQPVALQAQSDREDRKAPLIQSAGKEAGGINKASIQINIVA